MNLNQITLPSSNIASSRNFYLRMGFTLIVDSKEYLRFLCPDGDATFSLHLHDPNNTGGHNTSLVFFECEDLDERVMRLQKQGFVFESGPDDQSWLWREARLQDPDNNRLCLYRAGENRVNPPWRVNINNKDK
ncbi:MAG: VOC family protein [Gammaproteobacteria bacterium]|nr:VOC family protein [Gammaproteobacteria bacterium]NNC97702.1 VOC family protein [Gammaproteobacteria bacterium]NNM14038.1 VOC family protein [Gammaproteobacteria bacterium]